MNIDRTLQIIQFAYPKVYLACHTRHQRKRSTDHRLSARDSSILAHLDLAEPTVPAALARHLGVARSTLSEAVKRLTALGYTARVERRSVAGNRGGVGVLLTQRGAEAIRDTSVLETSRLRSVVELLSPAERSAVTRGMMVLAGACARRARPDSKNTETE